MARFYYYLMFHLNRKHADTFNKLIILCPAILKLREIYVNVDHY